MRADAPGPGAGYRSSAGAATRAAGRVSPGAALTTDTNDIGMLYPLLRLMSERLGRRLRRRGLTAGRLMVEATYADYTAGSRAVPLRAAMLDAELWDAARRAFVLANTKRLAVRAVALTLDR